MSSDPPDLSPFALAAHWVTKIFTVVALMVGPGILGHWVDEKLGVAFLLPVGLVFGLIAGIYYLLKLVGNKPR